MATDLREVLDDLKNPTARWITRIVLTVTVGLMVMVAVADGHIDMRQLLSIAVTTLVAAPMVILPVFILGDCLRATFLWYTSTAQANSDQQKLARHLALRAAFLGVVWVFVLFGGPPLIRAAMAQPTENQDVAPAQPPATRVAVPTRVLG